MTMVCLMTVKNFIQNIKNLQIESSNASQIVLHKLDISATSKYMCEVSADAPSFQTHMRSGDLNVYSEYNFLVHTHNICYAIKILIKHHFIV